jgi:hypothetical protein
MSTAPAGWEGILDEGETIVWQGRPDPAFHVGFGSLFIALIGLVFAGFAVFWMVMAAQAGGVFWMFGLIHFSIGAAMIVNAVYGDTIRRRGTWYTLTTRRAFIATNLPIKGKKLKSYPITGMTPLVYVAGPLATIRFAKEVRRGSKGNRYSVPIGFERIEDGETVYKAFRKVQEGSAA